MILNSQNVEDLVFFDQSLQKQLPEFKNMFDQWTLGKRVPGLSFLSQRTKLDFLEQLNDKHLEILSEYFNEQVVVNPINYRITENFKVPLDELENWLLERREFSNNISLWRDQNYAYLSIWR